MAGQVVGRGAREIRGHIRARVEAPEHLLDEVLTAGVIRGRRIHLGQGLLDAVPRRGDGPLEAVRDVIDEPALR